MLFSDPNLGDRARTASTVACLREPAFMVIDRIQRVDPADQLRAVALALTAMCEGVGINPHELVHSSQRMMSMATGPHTEHVQAIRDYAEGELRRAD